jgi:hypothetical protein
MPTVFFSWQADTETKTGRNLIERALERAASRTGDDTDVEEAIRDLSVDRDTKDVPGSPPIVDTIFQKIDKAAVFVPDLTFVGHRLDGRPTPNPNVLIEYGWALKSLGHRRIVPVMNTAFGQPSADAMPFNLRHLRNPILYHCPMGADDEMRRQARENLARELEHAIRAVLTSDEFKGTALQPPLPPPPPFQACRAADGPGRFRKRGEALGVSEGYFGRPSREIFLANIPVIWLRVMPTVEPGRAWLVTKLTKEVKTPTIMIEPFAYTAGGLHFVRGSDGFGIYTPLPGETEAFEVVFAFCNGEIWAIDAYLLRTMTTNEQRFIPDIENSLANGLQIYAKFLVKLGLSPPFLWEAGMEDARGRALYSRHLSPFRTPRLCLQDRIVASGTHSPDGPPRQSLKPFFSAVFDACGAEWSGK